MRKLIFIGLALSAALIVPPAAEAMEGDAQWCRAQRSEGGRECIYYTFEQCAASTERLNGGGCVENPNYRGGSTPAATRGVRPRLAHHRVPRHRPRHDDAYR
jgi:hypothetical protein